MPTHLVAVSTDVGEEASVPTGKGVEKIMVLIHMVWVQGVIHSRMAKMHPGIRGKHRQAMCLEMLKALVTDVVQRDIGRCDYSHDSSRSKVFLKLDAYKSKGNNHISDTQKRILEKLCVLSSRLYYTTIWTIEAHSVVDQKSIDSNTFKLWHDRLGHPGSTMMRRIITNSYGHPLLRKQIMVSSDSSC
ncbi:hypothetical protein L3X38_025232 [Prunus dulcis]|uniref:GAG-pre-integrase domain-containing protein n=1 Tax=Prunus dulcis TaxID=3755 RepID=A0AAD4W185_PRUDU|nr:hypothetical protein L3X38_025232 [Prunus dulcis]